MTTVHLNLKPVPKPTPSSPPATGSMTHEWPNGHTAKVNDTLKILFLPGATVWQTVEIKLEVTTSGATKPSTMFDDVVRNGTPEVPSGSPKSSVFWATQLTSTSGSSTTPTRFTVTVLWTLFGKSGVTTTYTDDPEMIVEPETPEFPGG